LRLYTVLFGENVAHMQMKFWSDSGPFIFETGFLFLENPNLKNLHREIKAKALLEKSINIRENPPKN
jgi:hypothetical protein